MLPKPPTNWLIRRPEIFELYPARSEVFHFLFWNIRKLALAYRVLKSMGLPRTVLDVV